MSSPSCSVFLKAARTEKPPRALYSEALRQIGTLPEGFSVHGNAQKQAILLSVRDSVPPTSTPLGRRTIIWPLPKSETSSS